MNVNIIMNLTLFFFIFNNNKHEGSYFFLNLTWFSIEYINKMYTHELQSFKDF